jgi:Doubled CXXCH motif (Paired_CXXCH_1)
MMARQPILAGIVLALALLPPIPVLAFHEQGVAGCGGCHTMHNSRDDAPVFFGGAGAALLKGEDATDVCLTCHASSHGAVLGSNPASPPPELGAGNFAFLQENDVNDAPGDPNAIGGHATGHSIVSPAWHLDPDPVHTVAPGGDFPAGDLGCTSCHDPHGNTNFRMLRGAGPLPNGFVFAYPAPLAEGVDIATETESPTSHTAYRDGWSDWCANCHGDYHAESGGFDHAGDRTLEGEAATYNQYDGPADPGGGAFATAYVPEVPLEDPAADVHGTSGATSASRVTCMTCHRAHATSAPDALRWDPSVLTLGEDGIASFSYPLPNPYADPAQLALCVKCHYPEAVDHGSAEPCMACHRFPTTAPGTHWSRFDVPAPSPGAPRAR